MIRLFDVENGAVVPTEHCYTIGWLKDIMEVFPKDYLKIYAYLFYMTYPSPENNPFFDVPEQDKEEMILQDIRLDISLDSPEIHVAMEGCKRLYETPNVRIYFAAKSKLEEISRWLTSTNVDGNSRDGNGAFTLSYLKALPDLQQMLKSLKDFMIDEQKGRTRGGKDKGYDQ